MHRAVKKHSKSSTTAGRNKTVTKAQNARAVPRIKAKVQSKSKVAVRDFPTRQFTTVFATARSRPRFAAPITVSPVPNGTYIANSRRSTACPLASTSSSITPSRSAPITFRSASRFSSATTTASLNMSSVPQLLSGKKIIITGASSGIGEAAVIDAIREGAQVVAIGRNEEKLKALKDSTQCDYLIGDLTSHEDCKRMVDEAVKIMGGLTSLVNCAGVLKGGAVGTATLENFQFNFLNNTQSVWSMMEHAVPHLKLNKEGEGSSIVNISSVNGQQSFAGVSAYCASKAAVDMLSKCAAVDLAEFNIRVNSICPGVVATNLQKTGGLSTEQYAAFIERSKTVTHPLAIPRGEVAQPQDVANLISFLVSEKSKWITGDNIKIDGGRACMGAR